MKSRSLAYHYFSLNVYDEFNSKKTLGKQHFYTIWLLGFLSAMAFYNLILYISSFYRANLYYFLYISTAVIWLSYSYGIFGQMYSVYGKESYWIHSFIMLMPVFLSLFIKSIFDTKNKYPTENIFLNSVFVLFLSTTALSFVDRFIALEITTWLYTYLGIVFTIITISFYRKGDPLAKYFLIGHIFFIIFDTISVLFFVGLTEFNYITSHAVGIGIALEAVMLAYIVSYRIKLLQEKEQNLLRTLDKKVEIRTKALRKVNLQYATSLEEKEALLKEIHHRVKNNMQVVSSLLGLQSMESEDENVQKVLKESENRIRSMMLVHEELYKSNSLAYIDAKKYFTSLFDELHKIYNLTIVKVRFEVKANNINISADTSIYIGLILSELITNSFKYAFVGKDEGLIEVLLNEDKDKSTYTLIVQDDGVGFDEKMKRNSFGSELIELLVIKQLHGTFKQTATKGVQTIINIPM